MGVPKVPQHLARELSRELNLWTNDLVRYLDESLQGLGVQQNARAVFEIPSDGKLMDTYELDIELPIYAIVTRAWYDVVTTFTSGTDAATIAIGIPTDDAAGIVAAIAISDGGNPWDAGYHEGIQTGTAATAGETLTAKRRVEIAIAVENITAGKLVLFLEYVVSEAA